MSEEVFYYVVMRLTGQPSSEPVAVRDTLPEAAREMATIAAGDTWSEESYNGIRNSFWIVKVQR